MNMFSNLRQLLYPPEFRIRPTISPDLTTYLRVIANLLDKNDIPQTTSEESLKFLIDISISFWRLRMTMLEPGTDQPLKSMRHAYDSLISPWNSLTQAGISIRDYTDALYNSSLAVTVVRFQEMGGLAEPKVIETIRPSIYLQGRPLLYSEVIVGVPISGRFGMDE